MAQAAERKPIYQLKGVGGQLELYESKVVIRRKGAIAKMNHGFKGDKEIPIRSISGVQLKLGGNLLNGYLQFAIPGGNENRGGVWDATKDENTVMFTKKDNETAQAIKDKILELQDGLNRPNTVSTSSKADELLKLKSLLDAGALTQEEFETEKQKVLA